MNETSQLNASMWLMVVIQSMTAIDLPGHGPRKLPAPKVYVLVIVLWSIFGLMADAGLSKAAAAMSWVTVLTATVVGQAGHIGAAGTTLINFLNDIPKIFGTQPPPTQGTILE